MLPTSSPFTVGQRVELHPALNAWMAGDRFGEVCKVTVSKRYVDRITVHVLMDRSGRIRRYGPDALSAV